MMNTEFKLTSMMSAKKAASDPEEPGSEQPYSRQPWPKPQLSTDRDRAVLARLGKKQVLKVFGSSEARSLGLQG